MTGTRAKKLEVSQRIQVRLKVTRQTESYGFKDIVKKAVTTHNKTLGRKNWQDTKEIGLGTALKFFLYITINLIILIFV